MGADVLRETRRQSLEEKVWIVLFRLHGERSYGLALPPRRYRAKQVKKVVQGVSVRGE